MQELNYHHLRYFWTVARLGTVVKAAEQLKVSQPTISAQIRELEAQFGVALFERVGRNLRLTQAGRQAYRYAEEIFRLGMELSSGMGAHQVAEQLSMIRIGVEDALPKLSVAQLMKRFYQEKLVRNLEIHEGKFKQLVFELQNFEIDLILSNHPGGAAVSADVTQIKLEDSLGAVYGAQSLLKHLRGAGKRRLLESSTWILPLTPSPQREQTDRWLKEEALQPKDIIEVQDSALAKVLAAEELGVVVAPLSIEESISKSFGLKRIQTLKNVRFPLFLLCKKEALLETLQPGLRV